MLNYLQKYVYGQTTMFDIGAVLPWYTVVESDSDTMNAIIHLITYKYKCMRECNKFTSFIVCKLAL